MYRIALTLQKIWERKTDTKTKKMNNEYHRKFEMNNESFGEKSKE